VWGLGVGMLLSMAVDLDHPNHDRAIEGIHCVLNNRESSWKRL